jgi:hypothetical protein
MPVSPLSVPESVALQVPAKQLQVDGAATPGILTVTNHRMYWTRRPSVLSKRAAQPSVVIYWPERSAIVEHRIQKHSLFVARGSSGMLRFWLSESDGARVRGQLTRHGFDTHTWA